MNVTFGRLRVIGRKSQESLGNASLPLTGWGYWTNYLCYIIKILLTFQISVSYLTGVATGSLAISTTYHRISHNEDVISQKHICHKPTQPSCADICQQITVGSHTFTWRRIKRSFTKTRDLGLAVSFVVIYIVNYQRHFAGLINVWLVELMWCVLRCPLHVYLTPFQLHKLDIYLIFAGVGMTVQLNNQLIHGNIQYLPRNMHTGFLLCCALLWLYIDWFSHIHQAYFTGTVAI